MSGNWEASNVHESSHAAVYCANDRNRFTGSCQSGYCGGVVKVVIVVADPVVVVRVPVAVVAGVTVPAW